MNDARSMPDALDDRIDAGLRRRFAVPADIEGLAARALPPRRLRLLPLLAIALAVAASIILLFWVSRPDQPEAQLSAQLPGGRGPEPLTPDLAFCRLVGPLLDGQPELGFVHSPDLVQLYREMDACQGDASTAACGASDFLAERMSATYGQALVLRPEAAGRLHGPFGSDDWPTATIMTGTSDDRTTVLVADRDDTLACCIQVRQPPVDSGLQLFTWKVGEVVFTEISPLPEAHLLPYVQ